MTTIKDNTIFDKTSFLESSNSSFIEELYLRYTNNPENVSQSWREFFDGLDEDQKIIKTEIQGPSWSPKKNNISKIKKPTVGFVAGITAPPGRKMGHAGAIISGGKGSAEDKIEKMKSCGIIISNSPALLGKTLQAELAR